MPNRARTICLAPLVLLALWLTACSPASTGGVTVAPTPAPAPTPSPAPTSAPAPTSPGAPTSGVVASDVLIIYHKTGGIAGIDETLTVHGDGRLDLVSRTGSVSHDNATPDEINQLRQALDSDDFAQLAPSYSAVGADLFVYTLTIPNGPAPRTVTTMDGVKNPPVLDQAISQLEHLRDVFN